jgi:hypothetical protein
MFFAMLFGAWVSLMTNATINHEDCVKRNHEPKACQLNKELVALDKKWKN